MKKLILSTLLLPFAGKTGIIPSSPSTTTVEIRSGAWPMSLEKEVGRSGKSYSLIFRDQQVMDAEVLDTLPFPNVEQLKFFGKALTYLKTGHNGDIAQFKDYSVKRAEKKYEKIQYILRTKFCLTDFEQAEADIMINAIKNE